MVDVESIEISKECTMDFIDKKVIEVTCQNIMDSMNSGLFERIISRVESFINKRLKCHYQITWMSAIKISNTK